MGNISNKIKPSIYELIKKYAFPLWKELILLIVLTLTANIFTTIQPVFISGLAQIIIKDQQAPDHLEISSSQEILSFLDLNHLGEKVNNYVSDGGTSLSHGNYFQVIVTLLGAFLLASLLASLFLYATNLCSTWVKVSSIRLIRNKISEHLLSLNLGYFQTQKTGELISRFTIDASNTATGIGPLLHSFLHHGLLIIIYSLYLFSTSIWLTLGALGIIVMQWVVTKLIKNPVRISERANFEKLSNVVSTFQETLNSMRVIKSFGADKFELDKLQKDIDESRQAEFYSGKIKAIEPHSRSFLDAFAIAGIFIIGIFQVQSEKLTIQGFILFIFIGKLLITPINKFSVCFVWAQALLASYDRLFEIFQVKNEVKDGDLQINNLERGIQAKEVRFSYGNQEVLRGLSFEIKKGEILAIVGPSGAGKSTITDLILRFYDPSSGGIYIDGKNLKNLKGVEYRKMFGVVPQESLLFHDTVAKNICFGREIIHQNQIEEAAKIANAHEFIINLPQGYETVVGDRGIKLSGGQRQRVSIARAIFSKPEIVIFDEATSSLDSESEKLVQLAIDKVLTNATAIIIAHRISTIINSDKIMVLNKSGIIEDIGIHKELLEKSSTYKKLYETQFEYTLNN